METLGVSPWCQIANNRQPFSDPRLQIKELGGLEQPLSRAYVAFPTATSSEA